MKPVTLTIYALALLAHVCLSPALAAENGSLSALEAQGATRRFDTEIAALDAESVDEFSWQLQYTSVLKKKHQLTALVPFSYGQTPHRTRNRGK